MYARNEKRWFRPLAFMAALGLAAASWLSMVPSALAQGKSFTVGYFPSWVGAWPVVIAKKKGLYAKHLPSGTAVNWDLQVVGPPIVNNMLAGKTDIGYFADFPAIVASTKRNIQDIRVVATNSWSAGQLCRVILVRSDAPQFGSPRDALKWLEGKTVALTKGTCMDRFWSFLEEKEGVKAEIVYQSPEVIATNLRAKKVDAGLLFQAHVAQIATRGIARVAVTGSPWNFPDGAFIVMRKEFIDTQRAAAKGFGTPGGEGGAGRISATRASCSAARPMWKSSPSGSDSGAHFNRRRLLWGCSCSAPPSVPQRTSHRS